MESERRMKIKAVSMIMLTLLLTGMLTLAFSIQTVKADGTIYIRDDGAVDPPDAPISSFDNITYTFTDNIYAEIIVERSNIVINGTGHTLQGPGNGMGFSLSQINNVTIKNTKMKTFWYGIYLYESSNNSIYGNNITNNNVGIAVYYRSSHNIISENNLIANNYQGIRLSHHSNYNIIFGNNVTTSNYDGIVLFDFSNYNIISENNVIANNDDGIYLRDSSSYNIISENNIIANNDDGILLVSSSNNIIYHNSFMDNAVQVHSTSSTNVWDNDVEGNYWSDYTGVDFFGGLYQNETGSDGIGDAPYVIDANNQDNYPLMNPWIQPDITVINVTPLRTIVGQGFTLGINVTITNSGSKIEDFDVIVYANTTSIASQTVTITSGNSTTVSFAWNTTSVPYGSYTITAYATPVYGESNTADNTFTDGWVLVTVPGDVDGDGECSVLDVKLVKLAYSGILDEPNADADGNGVINILDVKRVKLIYSGIL